MNLWEIRCMHGFAILGDVAKDELVLGAIGVVRIVLGGDNQSVVLQAAVDGSASDQPPVLAILRIVTLTFGLSMVVPHTGLKVGGMLHSGCGSNGLGISLIAELHLRRQVNRRGADQREVRSPFVVLALPEGDPGAGPLLHVAVGVGQVPLVLDPLAIRGGVVVAGEHGVVVGAPEVSRAGTEGHDALGLHGRGAVEPLVATAERQEREPVGSVGLGPGVVVVVQGLGGNVVGPLADGLLVGPLSLDPVPADKSGLVNVPGQALEGAGLLEENVPVVAVDHILVGHILLRHETHLALRQILGVRIEVGTLNNDGDDLALQLGKGWPACLGTLLDGSVGALQLGRGEDVLLAQMLLQEVVQVIRAVATLGEAPPEVVVDVDPQREYFMVRNHLLEGPDVGQGGGQGGELVGLVPPLNGVVRHPPVVHGRLLGPEQGALLGVNIQLQGTDAVIEQLVEDAFATGVAIFGALLEHLVVSDDVVPVLALLVLRELIHAIHGMSSS
mmetsp:Transcript_37702/g.67312  ORF Transcript_37702/g.67312 Transcript_37702/m.67312 type:complete len:501 (-) Transcript_37702:1092-2594(-)